MIERGTRVEISNPKHPCFGQRGVVHNLNRGNVVVELDDGSLISTRKVALRELDLLDKIVEAT